MRYRIQGVDAKTGKVAPPIEVDAPDERDAATLAKIQGVLATRITTITELLTVVKESEPGTDGSQTKRTTLISIEGRPLWFAATLALGLLIAAIWFVGRSLQSADHPATTPQRPVDPVISASLGKSGQLPLSGWHPRRQPISSTPIPTPAASPATPRYDAARVLRPGGLRIQNPFLISVVLRGSACFNPLQTIRVHPRVSVVPSSSLRSRYLCCESSWPAITQINSDPLALGRRGIIMTAQRKHGRTS